MKPIYKPKGKAAEYADLALNIYTGCSNGCTYCYAPAVLRKSRDAFAHVKPREGIVEATKGQLASGNYKGKTIHLCFTCDPYPFGIDPATTTNIIKAIKDAGAHVQILTKRPSEAFKKGQQFKKQFADIDLLDSNDMFGVTITGSASAFEPNADLQSTRISALKLAHGRGIGTWVSCEPILGPSIVRGLIREGDYIDLFKFGKLNYSSIGHDWGELGREIEYMCKLYRRNYVIKESLREEMERDA